MFHDSACGAQKILKTFCLIFLCNPATLETYFSYKRMLEQQRQSFLNVREYITMKVIFAM